MTGMLSEVPRGSTRHPCELCLWCGQDWGLSIRGQALMWSPALIRGDGWLVLPWPVTKSSKEHCFKSIMLRSEVFWKAWSIESPFESFNTLNGHVWWWDPWPEMQSLVGVGSRWLPSSAGSVRVRVSWRGPEQVISWQALPSTASLGQTRYLRVARC